MAKRVMALTILTLTIASYLAYGVPEHRLLEQARRESPDRFRYALENGANIDITPDSKTFYILWLPKNAMTGEPPPIIATIHGHASWAFDEFYLWHKEAAERGYGVLAIQWWLGEGERYQDYLMPHEIYRIIDQVLEREGVGAESVLFHGFSRGSANCYAVTALDRTKGRGYFTLTVANAGKPSAGFPPNAEIEDGVFGPKPFGGTHWVTFAGGKDPNPDRDGIEGMREAASWIRRYGGIVDLAIEDKNADHGGFHKDPKNMRAALDIFQKRLESAHN